MSKAVVGNCSWNRRAMFTCLTLAIVMSGCSASNTQSGGNWKTYSNPRYGFEYPYPSNWVTSPPPDNEDGQAFTSPQNPAVEIRGWASNRLPNLDKHKAAKSVPNFKTQQGLSGQLTVELGADVSSMTLTLTKGQVCYNWRGHAPSQQFDDYYRFFYYIAEQYRVPEESKK